MRTQFVPRTFHLFTNLALVASLTLSACSSATPITEPTTTAPVTLAQALERWNRQRVPVSETEIGFEISAPVENDPISHTTTAQLWMVQGDMQMAMEMVKKSIEIDPEINISHYFLGELIYRLAFFDLMDRQLCIISPTPAQEIPEVQLHHGHLQIEVMELVSSGRPAVYQDILSSKGIDEKEKFRIQFYMFSRVPDLLPENTGVEDALEMLGGPPETLPVPECKPDERSLPLLRDAYDEILLGKEAKVVEIPGVTIIQMDRIANLEVRLQVLLGEDIIPVSESNPVTSEEIQGLPSVLPSALTQDPDLSRIIYEIIKTTDAKKMGQIGGINPFDELITEYESQLTKDPDNLMLRFNLAYMHMRSHQYEQALNHYLIASAQAPDLADPFIGLGRIYYNLAIFDMIDRGLTSQTPEGLFQFYPDEQTVKILQLAKETFLTAKKLTRLEVKDENGVTVMISPPGTEDEFLQMIENHLGGN